MKRAKDVDLTPNDSGSSSESNVSLTSKLFIIVFIFLCSIGVIALSLLVVSKNSLRLDEAQSLWQTSHSLAGTLKVVAQDVHVPLYHVILHFWQLFVGTGIESARYLSLGFFIATIPIVYILARRVLSINWSLFVVFLFSFSPFMNWYANEARMYTLLALVVTLSQYYFIRLIETAGKKGWIGYTITAMLGVYTHYFFIFNLMSQGIYFIFNRRKFAKGTLKRLIFLAVALLVWLSPWLIYFYFLGLARNTSPNLSPPSTVDFSNVYSQFLFGFQNNNINTILVSSWPILVVATLFSVKYGQRLNKKMGYILVAVFVPVLLAFGLSYTISPFFLSRYMIASLAPLLILAVWFISNYKKRFSFVIASAFIIILTVVSVQQYFSSSTPVKENYKTVAEVLNKQVNPSDIIVLSAPFTIYPFQYYYNGDAKVASLPIWDRTVPGAIPSFDESQLPEQVSDLNSNHQYVYLLLSYDQGYEEQIFQYYEQRFERVSNRQFSDDLNLFVYRVGYSQAKPIGEVNL